MRLNLGNHMDVRLNIVGHANMGPAAKELQALQTQIVSLQKQMAMAHTGTAQVAPKQARLWRQASRVMEETYNDAVASTGRFTVAQQKVNNVTDDFISRINKQKVSFSDLRREMSTAQAAYQQHLRMQKATVASFRTDAQGNVLANLAVPKNIVGDLDNVRQRLGYVRALTESIGTQTVNWGKNIQWSGRQMTVGMTIPLGMLATAAGVAAYEVDNNLTRIAKVYDTTAQSGIEQERELMQVRVDSMETAKDAAREYGAAVKDTLDIQSQWAAMGINGADLQKQTSETVRLATLGEIDYQTAIGATIAMQSVFKMNTQETAEAINYMNAVENATILSLEDFATAIPIAAAPVRQLGGDIKDLGVMLTAMRARGIDANEGANAIKSAMTRIFRPSKQIREEFQQLTNVDLTDLVNKTQGELIPTLQEIGKAVDGLSNVERTKAIAGLFGTYQNTRLSGLLAGMFEDMDDQSSQVFRAMEAGAMTAQETSALAAKEMARQQESASGRIKRAWESLKASLAADGMGFLSLGADLLETANGVMGAWDRAPEFFKNMVKYGAMAAAAIGPVVMTVGVLGNAFGMGLRAFAKFLPRVELLTTQEKAQRAVVDELRKSNMLAAESTATYATEINALTAALERAGAAKQKYLAGATKPGPEDSPANRGGMVLMPPELTARGEGEKPLAGRALRAKTASEYKNEARAQLAVEEKITQENARRNELMGGMAVSSALITAGTLAQVVPMGETAEKAGTWATSFGIGLMTMQAMAPVLKTIVDRTKMMAANMGAGKGIRGSLSSITLGLNPFAVAVATAGATIYAMNKYLGESSRQVEKMRTDAEGLGSIFGFEATDGFSKAGDDIESTNKKVEELTKQYPKLIENIRAAKNDQEAFDRAASAGLLAFNHGATEDQAREVVRTALAAAQSESYADSVMMRFDFDPNNIKQTVNTAIQAFRNGIDEAQNLGWAKDFAGLGAKEMRAVGEQAGVNLAGAMNTAIQNGDYAGAYKAFDEITREFFSAVDGADYNSQATEKFFVNFANSVGIAKSKAEDDFDAINKAARNAAKGADDFPAAFEEAMQTGLLEYMQDINSEITNGAGSARDLAAATQAMASAAQGQRGALDSVASAMSWSTTETSRQLGLAMEQLGAGKRLNELTFEQQQLLGMVQSLLGWNLTSEAAIAQMKARQNAETLNSAAIEQMRGTILNALSQKQQDNIASVGKAETKNNDAAIAGIEKRQDALDSAHKKQQQRLEDEHDREQKLLDKRWDKREKALERERELNKKKYDEEIDYINKSLEAQNRQTDVTIALRQGDLDQVAKLQAEGSAGNMVDALGQARDASDAKYADREEKLKAQRKAAEDNLKAIQEAEKRAMEARQEREKKALQNKLKALQTETKAVKTNNAAQSANDKAKLDLFMKNLDLTKIKSKKDMVALGRDMQRTFGLTKSEVARIFEAMWGDIKDSTEPGDAARVSMKKWIIGAGKELGLKYSEAAGLAKRSMKSMMRSQDQVSAINNDRNKKGPVNPDKGGRQTKHSGGSLGNRYGSGSRAGYPRSAREFPSEVSLLAKKSEYVVSGKAHQKYGTAELDAVNKGTATILRHTGGAVSEYLKMGSKAMAATADMGIGQAVYKRMVKRYKAEQDAKRAAAASNGVVGGGGFKRPTGKWNSPWNGHHTTGNGHDYNLSYKPLYAPADGKVTAHALPGYEPRAASGGNGFRSYGQYIKFAGQGQSMMFAHLSKLPVGAGKSMNVKAGQYMGTTGSTGNSSGPHVHVELPFGTGNTNNFGNFFRAAGVSLRKGGKLRYDNTIVRGHKGETMLSSRITKRFENNLINGTSGGNTYGDIHVTIGSVDGGSVGPEQYGRRMAMEMKKELDREDNRYGRKR